MFEWFFLARCQESWRIGDSLDCMNPADIFIAICLAVVVVLLLTKGLLGKKL